MIKLKKIINSIPIIIILILAIYFKDNITEYIVENYIYYFGEENISSNSYKLDYDFMYVKNSSSFKISNKEELINHLYTLLNSGVESSTFLCKYADCKKDVKEIIDSNLMSDINNYVHPYNSFKRVLLSINSFNKITITFEKTYTDDEIKKVENEIDNIIANIITDNMSIKEKITVFHDYIINNTKYDINYIKEDLDDIDSSSHNATGVLFNKQALCGGYADVMSIFLNKLNIKNFQIASDAHVWNAVYLDNNWYHIDLTWDDPINSDGSDILLNKFLLINDKELKSLNTKHHNYNENIYLEF